MVKPWRFALWILVLAGCRVTAHSIDDLEVVHEEVQGKLIHRFEVERFSGMGGWFHFGALGRLFGGFGATRHPETLEDPFGFCAERVEALAEVNRHSPYDLATGCYWAGKILLQDPNLHSRIFAAGALEQLGEIVVTPAGHRAALENEEGEYEERVKGWTTALAAHYDLLGRGQEAEPTTEPWEARIQQLAKVRYARPEEGLAVAQLLGQCLEIGGGEDEEALVRGVGTLLARSLPQALFLGCQDSNEFVREACLVALHRLAGKEVLPSLVGILRADTSPIVRRKLATLCGELSLAEARVPEDYSPLEFLAKATRDGDGSVAVNAMASLSKITNKDPNFQAEYWRSWWEEYLLQGK